MLLYCAVHCVLFSCCAVCVKLLCSTLWGFKNINATHPNASMIICWGIPTSQNWLILYFQLCGLLCLLPCLPCLAAPLLAPESPRLLLLRGPPHHHHYHPHFHLIEDLPRPPDPGQESFYLEWKTGICSVCKSDCWGCFGWQIIPCLIQRWANLGPWLSTVASRRAGWSWASLQSSNFSQMSFFSKREYFSCLIWSWASLHSVSKCSFFQPSIHCRQEFTKLSDSLVACPASKLGVLATITKRQSKISILPFSQMLRLESKSVLAPVGKNWPTFQVNMTD